VLELWDGTRMNNKQFIYSQKPTQAKQQVGYYRIEATWCMDKPQANTNLQDSPQPELRGNHHLPLYSIICAWPLHQHPMSFCPKTPTWEPQNSQKWDSHDFGGP